MRVGDELQKVLEGNGIETVHIREIFDSPVYTGAYDRSLAVVEDTLAEYPSITTVIDVHRDSILTDDGRAYKTSCTINGEETAQLMLVVGTDDGGLYRPGLAGEPESCSIAAVPAQPHLSDAHASA